jgi:phosphohistidine swiveling domain-containing protein
MDADQRPGFDQLVTYQIKIKGKLDERWTEWFGGMTISVEGECDGTLGTTLTGPVVDQAALRGILSKIWDLNLTLISVKRTDEFSEHNKEGDRMSDVTRSFNELAAEQQFSAGGKGGTLARLYQAGYPVPEGFVILPAAFDGDKLRSEAWAQVRARLAQIRRGEEEAAFAVRSSALSEDSAQASFAGEFETVLDVHTDEMIREAIHTVRRSRHSERVQAYSQVKGMAPGGVHEVAVVVQRLVRADISGVLFTADPVSGDRMSMIGNYIYGLGDELVSGEAEPYTFALAQPKGRYSGPSELERYARRLYELATRLGRDLGCPQDIEWCVADGKLYLLQSRPITTLVAHDPATGEWNATLTGDYLWTNVLNVEVFPLAAKPSTWSVWKRIAFDVLSLEPDRPGFGNIAGRFYLNYSMMHSFMLKIMRDPQRTMDVLRRLVTAPPEGTDVPPFPVPTRALLFNLIPQEIRNNAKKKRLKKDRAEFLAAMPGRCRELRRHVRETKDKSLLISLWQEVVEPLCADLFALQDAFNEDFGLGIVRLRGKLSKLLGESDANMLLATSSGHSEQLASVGPLVGLSKLRSGDMTRETYLEQYGHRGPYENYISVPRPYEDPDWLDGQLEGFDKSPADIESMLKGRRPEFDAVWEGFAARLAPGKQRAIKRKIEELVETCLAREATRSELTRVVGVARDIFVRGGELTGLGDGVFYLTVDELIDVLSGDESSTATIPARRETHKRYAALPPLPSWIRGRFDPFQWAADPDRRMDVYDPHAPVSALESGDVVKGTPGSAGRAEGVVRRIDRPEEGHQLQPGEILVAATTNIGWTPLFPRAAAVVTDVGAQLSHAAIVARELGIPAVVGCGTATMRLKTGDRVRVDGGRGIVDILDSSGA